MDSLREALNSIAREASPYRTICEVLREAWESTDDEKVQGLLVEALYRAKKMDAKLRQYSELWSADIYEDNLDYQEDKKRRRMRVI